MPPDKPKPPRAQRNQTKTRLVDAASRRMISGEMPLPHRTPDDAAHAAGKYRLGRVGGNAAHLRVPFSNLGKDRRIFSKAWKRWLSHEPGSRKWRARFHPRQSSCNHGDRSVASLFCHVRTAAATEQRPQMKGWPGPFVGTRYYSARCVARLLCRTHPDFGCAVVVPARQIDFSRLGKGELLFAHRETSRVP
jgi:hypothetical protein